MLVGQGHGSAALGRAGARMAHGVGDLWTVAQTMTFLDLGRSTIYSLLARGELVRVHTGRRAWVLAASVHAYLDRAVSAATPPGGIPLGPTWPPGTVGALEHGVGSPVAPEDREDPEGPG